MNVYTHPLRPHPFRLQNSLVLKQAVEAHQPRLRLAPQDTLLSQGKFQRPLIKACPALNSPYWGFQHDGLLAQVQWRRAVALYSQGAKIEHPAVGNASCTLSQLACTSSVVCTGAHKTSVMTAGARRGRAPEQPAKGRRRGAPPARRRPVRQRHRSRQRRAAGEVAHRHKRRPWAPWSSSSVLVQLITHSILD